MKNLDLTDYLIKVEEMCKITLRYSKDPYALDNATQLQELTKKFINNISSVDMKVDNFFNRDIYPTPNVSVRAIILSEDKRKVLLVQEKYDLGFSFPGGWSELGLSPIESIKKEVREEAGCECEIIRLVGVTDRYKNIKTTHVPEYILTYLVKVVGDMKESCFEIASKDYYDVDNLPTFSKKNDTDQMKKLLKAAINNETILD